MKKGSKVPKNVGRILAGYLAYSLLLGVFSYMIPVHAKKTPDPEQFYGKEVGPDRALLVEEPKEAFSRRVELIRSAKNTLDVCCHCAKVGETTDCFFAEIIKAADRGVQVRVLLDGVVGGLAGPHKDIALALRSHPNISYGAYNPVNLLKPWEWNVRFHDKFILADDRMMMLGGRNIGDEYFDPPGYEGAVTHDRDVLVLNTKAGTPESDASVTAQGKAYMELLWASGETDRQSPLSGARREQGIAAQERMRKLADRWETSYPSYYLPAEAAEEKMVPTRQISLLYNPLGNFKKEPALGAAVAELLKNRESVRIQTPYATAGKETLEALHEIAESAQVDFLTNSVASSPNFPAFSAYMAKRKAFLETGIRIHEYQSRDSIHGKSCVADGHLSVVGSFNLDDRSLYIDTESVLVIDSPEFYEQLNGAMEELFAQSALVGPDNEYAPDQPVKPVEASAGRRGLMKVVSVFSRAFRYLI